MPVDTDPTSEAIVQRHFDHKAVHELLLLINDQVSDGYLSDDETRSIRAWLSDHPDLTVIGPGQRVADLLVDALEDGVLAEAEREELFVQLRSMTGDYDD